jgi:hypothetical protein
MEDTQDSKPKLMRQVPVTIVGTLATQYGSWAFGLVCVLLIWEFIMQPQLDSMKIDYEEHRKIVATMHDTAAAMNFTAATMESTSHILERQTDMLEDILDRDKRSAQHDPRVLE